MNKDLNSIETQREIVNILSYLSEKHSNFIEEYMTQIESENKSLECCGNCKRDKLYYKSKIGILQKCKYASTCIVSPGVFKSDLNKWVKG